MNQQTERAWTEHRGEVLAFLRRRLPEPAAAEDLTQDVFLRLHRAQPALEGPGAVRAWLLSAARNLLVDYFRSRRDHVPPADDLANPVDAAASLRQLEPCIGPLLARLPEPYRTALACDLDGLPQREIAHRQGISLAGAKSRVQRARVLLQRQFERCCDYVFDHDGALVGFTPRAGRSAG